jgi:hypothetical protein
MSIIYTRYSELNFIKIDVNCTLTTSVIKFSYNWKTCSDEIFYSSMFSLVQIYIEYLIIHSLLEDVFVLDQKNDLALESMLIIIEHSACSFIASSYTNVKHIEKRTERESIVYISIYRERELWLICENSDLLMIEKEK